MTHAYVTCLIHVTCLILVTWCIHVTCLIYVTHLISPHDVYRMAKMHKML